MSMTSDPLVSVVTPVYNEEECLPECVESVLKQTYKNWDLTIVDNCSTDKTLEIARRYAARDSRIRVHRTGQFLPMLANHNVAIRQISPKSKYVKVVLGDDWIFPNCLDEMVGVAEAHTSVGIVSAYERCGDQVRLTGLGKDVTVVAGREACREFLRGTLLLFGSQSSVLYRADLVRSRDPFYVETDRFADFESCFALLRGSDLGFVHQILTYSRPRARSEGAISSDVGAQHGSSLGLLFTYGKDCLRGKEFEDCLNRHVSEYYEFLGRRVWVERNHAFWEYHRRIFHDAGIPFNRVRLAGAALMGLVGFLADPQAGLMRVRRAISLQSIRNGRTRSAVLGSKV